MEGVLPLVMVVDFSGCMCLRYIKFSDPYLFRFENASKLVLKHNLLILLYLLNISEQKLVGNLAIWRLF